MAATWRLRAWDDPDLEQLLLDDGIIAMSNDELGDLSMGPNDAELRVWLRQAYPQKSKIAIGIFVRYWKTFLSEMHIGDHVVVPLRDSRYALGTITSSYRYRSVEPDPRLRHVREVAWVRVGPRSDLPDDVRKVVGSPGTVCRVRAAWPS